MKKLNIAVIFGGCSSEYGVSLESAYSVINNLDQKKYHPVPVGITEKGQWFYFTGDIAKIKDDTWCNSADCIPAVFSPDRGSNRLLLLEGKPMEAVYVDAAFPVLHGRNGEDGTVQG
ncbi:MAG: D-alanine--(R)-lactate ligase, partial [Lachnospiraceae bacterium]|nr:D-alanine--(R)-lactate ligase [Lachnospiraceae bacterium]